MEHLKTSIEKLEGTGITVGSGWVRKNAETLYDMILEKIEQFSSEPDNQTDVEDVEKWKSDGFLVDIYFGETGMEITAGFDDEELNNQPTWFVFEYEDYDSVEELENILLKGIGELQMEV